MRIAGILRPAGIGPRLLLAALLSFAGTAAFAADEPATQAFKRLDRNGDGVVVFEEFVQASDERLAGMDRNRDGDIGRDEFMAFQDAEEQRRVDRVFVELDKKRTGKLTAAQLSSARLGGPEAQRLLRCDLDKDGVITRAEYLDCRRRVAERWMQRIFAKYDKNGDGFIGREERVAALRDFFGRLDANGDGKVTPEEFAAAHKRWTERRNRPADPPSGRASQPSTDMDEFE